MSILPDLTRAFAMLNTTTTTFTTRSIAHPREGQTRDLVVTMGALLTAIGFLIKAFQTYSVMVQNNSPAIR
nr:hypothetical transcript [Hymenolepis microstoma]